MLHASVDCSIQRKAAYFSLIVLLFLLSGTSALAASPITVTAHEDGSKRTGQAEIWHDTVSVHSLDGAIEAYRQGLFKPLETAGSTGLQTGSFWSHFSLRNPLDQPLTLHLEYVDHQLIYLNAFSKSAQSWKQYEPLTSLSLNNSFNERPISHNRFVIPVELAPGETREFMVEFGSESAGFVFPSLRIWSPKNLANSHTLETGVIFFLFGGFLLMSLFALVGGIATGEKSFFAYAVYSLSKITVWGTILGYTHQYVLPDDFHWSYMSISGAVTIFCGLVFARTFLQTRRNTPRLDYVLLFMMTNALLLLTSAMFGIKLLALITITLALLLYPMMTIVGLVRWRQGSTEAGIFAIAWSLLVFGLVVQAFRDMGYVEHNFVNYYWPPIASFTELLTIMAAMGIKVRRLRHQKEDAEHRYLQHLERSKAELEQIVQERTKELEAAKRQAELEARTDPLTGIHNRRSFLDQAQRSIKFAVRKQRPVSLLMFDIDHFKSINDTHGHIIGDQALKCFTETILECIRETDVFGRIGGEEFGLLISEDKQGALQTAERLRDQISRICIDSGVDNLQFTSSIGIAHLNPESDSIESLLKQADEALYVAKRQGRNGVVEYQPAA